MRTLFKWFRDDSEDAVKLVSWFANNFPDEEFDGAERLLVLFLQYCDKLHIAVNKSYLQSFLRIEGKRLIKQHNVRLPSLESYDYKEAIALEEATREISQTLMTVFEDFTKVVEGEVIDYDLFKVNAYEFIQRRKKERFQKVMATAFPKLNNGDDLDDTMSEVSFDLAMIDAIYNVNKLDRLDFLVGKKSSGKSVEQRFICDTGLPMLDTALGGIFSTQVHAFTSQPGAGKTRFGCILYAYRCAVIYKKGVLIDELELTKTEVENILIAHHIVNIFGGKVKIPDSLINRGQLTDQQKQYVEAARIDLFESGKYGRILIRTENIVVERLQKDMLSFLKHNRDIELWMVDYAGLAKSQPVGKYAPHLKEYERISELYINAKEICKTADIACIIINQFNADGVSAALAGKAIYAGHIQGGQIIERHADASIVMTMTAEQELSGHRCISTDKQRSATPIKNMPVQTDLAVSIFRQVRIDGKS